jgi:IS5 family transposase
MVRCSCHERDEAPATEPLWQRKIDELAQRHAHAEAMGGPFIRDRTARQRIARNDRPGRHRWAVERIHAWLAAFGKLRTRFERRIDIHIALLSLACCVTCLPSIPSF